MCRIQNVRRAKKCAEYPILCKIKKCSECKNVKSAKNSRIAKDMAGGSNCMRSAAIIYIPIKKGNLLPIVQNLYHELKP
jgi:hypothetical protein